MENKNQILFTGNEKIMAESLLGAATIGADLAIKVFRDWFERIGYDRLGFSAAEFELVGMVIIRDLGSQTEELTNLCTVLMNCGNCTELTTFYVKEAG